MKYVENDQALDTAIQLIVIEHESHKSCEDCPLHDEVYGCKLNNLFNSKTNKDN